MQKSLWWFKVCWILVALTIGAALLHAPGAAVAILYGAAAISGGASAEYLEQVRPTLLTDFFWFLTPAALFLFPMALVLHSVRIHRLRSLAPAHGV
jgi:hypothetical protein